MSISSLNKTAGHPNSSAAYAELRRTIIAAGLLKRRYGYYIALTSFSFALLLVSVALPFFVAGFTGLVSNCKYCDRFRNGPGRLDWARCRSP